MAKRKRLTPPTDVMIDELPSPSPKTRLAPIASVAAESAAQISVLSPEERSEQARKDKDAASWQDATSEGRVITRIPLSQIAAQELVRDRLTLEGEDFEALIQSLSQNGLRLPVEVFALKSHDGAQQYGLLSGFRRLAAFKRLYAETGDENWASIPSLIRPHSSVAESYAAMVEENEIRADLSFYERGRIAVVAAGQGAFNGIEAAVQGLYPGASKARKSKIRSFALIHEELGDMLSFATALSERAGLRVAMAVRGGFGPMLREALAAGQGVDASSEWAVMEPVLVEAERSSKPHSRGGRPKQPRRNDADPEKLYLSNGITLTRENDGKSYLIRFEGEQVDLHMLDTVMLEIQRLLSADG